MWIGTRDHRKDRDVPPGAPGHDVRVAAGRPHHVGHETSDDRACARHPNVAAWLNYEDRHPLGPDPLLYGFGCTSMTVHLPNLSD
ncbi:hypothetical protein SPHINGO8AM_80064 [Sphingomonas sp. 8AM]|nr:hypothetical protein SPHINGO8AM_80064 [Sphingomonas sp. 8AM]